LILTAGKKNAEIILPVLGNLIRIRRSSSQGYNQYPELDIRLSLYQIINAWGVMFLLGNKREKINNYTV